MGSNEKTAGLERFLKDIPEKDGWYARVEEIPGTEGLRQIILEKPKGAQNLNYAQHDYVLKNQLEELDKADADAALLKTPCCQEWLSLEMCKYFNNHMAEYSKKSNGRLIPLAVIPPYGTKENIEELVRCHDELGMVTGGNFVCQKPGYFRGRETVDSGKKCRTFIYVRIVT